MYTFIVIFHVLACLALILIVLLQTGRGAEMGAAFGGASQTLFGGGGGSTFLSKLTTGAAVVFMLTCLSLTYLSVGPSGRSVMEDVSVTHSEGMPVPDAKPLQPLPEPTKTPEASAKPFQEVAPPADAAISPDQESVAAPQPTVSTAPETGGSEAKKSEGASPGKEEKKPVSESRSQGRKQDKTAEPVRKQ